MIGSPASDGARPRPTRRRTGGACRLAGAVLVATAPVVAWWAVGPIPIDIDGAGLAPSLWQDPGSYDYMIRPPAIRPSIERAAGLVATGGFLLAAVTVVVSARRGRFDRRWWWPVGILVVISSGLGVAERVVTAPVIGANFGGLFIVVFGTPAAMVFGLAAAIRSVQILRTDAE